MSNPYNPYDWKPIVFDQISVDGSETVVQDYREQDIRESHLYTILSREFTFAQAEESGDLEVRAWLADDPDYQAGDRDGWLVVEREAIGDEVQELVAQGWAVKDY